MTFEDVLYFLLTLLVVFLIIFIFVFILKRKARYDKKQIEEAGKIGENIVAKRLNEIAIKYGGYLFNDFLFRHKYSEDYSTEIDHILITCGGIFIIETKNNSGMILGKNTDKEWVCIKPRDLKNKTFRNPINQNQVHINCLKRMFSNTPPSMESMIIFVNADISNIDNQSIYNLDNAIDEIEKRTISNKYSREFVDRIYKQILEIQNKYSITKEEHIKNIKRSHNS